MIEEHNNITGISFTITSTKLYFQDVTMSINDNIKFLGNIKQGFKRTFSWSKYRSEITAQPENNWLIQHLGILIDFLIFYSKMVMIISLWNLYEYYMPSVVVVFFDEAVKNKQAYGKFI